MTLPIRRSHGFTLIELMIVSAIIGLLAGIALPKFGNMVIRSKEAAVKGKLGSLRSALTLYYADSEGIVPTDISLALPFIDKIPRISIPTVPSHVDDDPYGCSEPFVSDWNKIVCTMHPQYAYFGGKVVVNCTHRDSSGRIWSTW